MNRDQWAALIRMGATTLQIAEESLRNTWRLPVYIGELSAPPLFVADTALHVMGLLRHRYARRGNPWQKAALTAVGGMSAYLEPVQDADPRAIIMVINRSTEADALADCLADCDGAAVAREVARIGRLTLSLDEAAKGKR